MSIVMCHMSLLFIFFNLINFLGISLDKMVEIVGGGSVINGAEPVLCLGWFPDSIWSFDDSNKTKSRKVQVYLDESLKTSKENYVLLFQNDMG